MVIEYGRFDANHNVPPTRRTRWPTAVKKPRQEICALLKWFCFALNCVIFVCGVTLLALGVYLWIKDPRTVEAVEDVVLNPSIVLMIGGLFVSFVALAGLFGSLRDNSSLLKTSVWSAALGYVALVFGVFGLFFVFFADSAELLSMNSIMTYAVQKYHTNHNMADFVDYVQENLECCGIRSISQGYRDWNLSEQFQCNRSNLVANPYPERCGVPFSCCRRMQQPDLSGNAGSLVPAMRSLQCWQNAQTKRPQELENDLNVRGCMAPLRQAFETHAVLIGSTVAMTLVPGLFYIFMEYVLARQIDYQHFLLHREARRHERRIRRAKREDKIQVMEAGTGPTITINPNAVKSKPKRRSATSVPPPPANAVSPAKRSKSRDAKQVKEVKKEQKDSAATKVDKQKAKRRSRSSAPQIQMGADPGGKVRHWILQQSDFMPPTKNEKS